MAIAGHSPEHGETGPRSPGVAGRRGGREHAAMWAAVLVGGTAAIWALRQPWGERLLLSVPLWFAIVVVGLVGGRALRDGIGQRTSTDPTPGERRDVGPSSPSRRVAGGACLALAIALVGSVVVHLWPDYLQWHGTVLPWVAALVLVVLGLQLLGGGPAKPAAAPSSPAPFRPPTPAPSRTWRSELVFFVLILCLAAVLRCARLSTIPAGIWHDETDASLDALAILDGRGGSPFATGWYQTPNGFIYFMAGVYRLFGATYLSLKLVSLIPAILTVAAVYPLGRMLFGPTVGFAAMFLMAVSRWHLSMSRWGWNELAPPLFQIVATYLVIKGLQRRRYTDLAVGGIVAGLMLYTYPSARLALFTVVAAAVLWPAMDPTGGRAALKRSMGGLGSFVLGLSLATAPLAVTYVRDPQTFTHRLEEVSILKDIARQASLRPLLDNTVDHLRFFLQDGDRNGRHNLPGEPELDPILGVLFVLGLGRCLTSLRDRRFLILLVWLVLALANGILTVRYDSPQSYRTIAVVPVVALLTGEALVRLRHELGSSRTGPGHLVPAQRATVTASILTAGALVGAGIWEVAIFFGPQASYREADYYFGSMETKLAGEVAAALRLGRTVYLGVHLYDASQVRFIAYGLQQARTGEANLDRRPYNPIVPEFGFPLPADNRDAELFLAIENEGALGYFASFYPHLDAEIARAKNGSPWYLRILVPASDIEETRGLTARLSDPGGGIREIVVSRPSATPLRTGRAGVEWIGGLSIRRTGRYDLCPSKGLAVTLDDVPWNGPRFLAAGPHTLRMWRAPGAASGTATLEWVTPGSRRPAEEIPDNAYFRSAVPPEGLLGTYYGDPSWQGRPLFRQLTPYFLLAWPEDEPLPGGFSARYEGRLRIRTPGRYGFRIYADDGARLVIDGNVVCQGLASGRSNEATGEVNLAPGDHPIELDYFQMGGGTDLRLFWRQDDGQESVVPPTVLFPASP